MQMAAGALWKGEGVVWVGEWISFEGWGGLARLEDLGMLRWCFGWCLLYQD